MPASIRGPRLLKHNLNLPNSPQSCHIQILLFYGLVKKVNFTFYIIIYLPNHKVNLKFLYIIF